MVKIIEARALLTAKDDTGKAFASVAKNMQAMSQAHRAFAKAGTTEMSAMARQIDAMNGRLGQIQGFKQASRDLDGMGTAMRRAQQEAQRMKSALDGAASPTKGMSRDFERAAQAADAAKRSFIAQGQAVRDMRSGLDAAGVPVRNLAAAQKQLEDRVKGATTAMQRQAALTQSAPRSLPAHQPPSHTPQAGGGSIVPVPMQYVAPAAVAYGANKLHKSIVEQHHDFQKASLYQQAVLDMSPGAQQPLRQQSIKIGGDTGFTNADVVKAQTDIGSKLPKDMQTPAIIAPITEAVKNYALAMKVSMEDGAVAIVGAMKARQMDMSTPEAAAKSSRDTANRLVQRAKITGAKHHDIVADTKFGEAPSAGAGFSPAFGDALSAQLNRLGFEGAQSGTFKRAVAFKLAVPSRQGQAALAGAGIDLNSYIKPGVDASAGGLSTMLQQRFGRKLDPAQAARIQSEILDKPEEMADKGQFMEKVSEILNSSFAKKDKKGRVNVQDSERITKTLDQFYNTVSQGTDVERLMTDLVKKGLTAALARYIFGQEQGGRAIGLNSDQLEKDKRVMENVPDDLASQIAAKMQEGAQGEYVKMTGAVQTFVVSLGEASDGLRSFTYKGIGAAFDYLNNLITGKKDEPKLEGNLPVYGSALKGALGDYDRSMQAQRERNRDPEAARGRAFGTLNREPLSREMNFAHAFTNLKATVEHTVDVTGKLDPVKLEGSGQVNVSVTVKGGGQVTGMSSSSSGHIKVNAGAAMSEFDTP